MERGTTTADRDRFDQPYGRLAGVVNSDFR
jgi:hypothetical protein